MKERERMGSKVLEKLNEKDCGLSVGKVGGASPRPQDDKSPLWSHIKESRRRSDQIKG